MKYVPIILGRRAHCYHCGYPIRTVILPQIDPSKWQMCEDFDGTPDHIELHDCPQYPAKRTAA